MNNFEEFSTYFVQNVGSKEGPVSPAITQSAAFGYGSPETAEGIFDSISEDFSSFILDIPQEDDITLIIVKRLPKGKKRRNPVQLTLNRAKKVHDQGKENKWKWGAEKMH